MITITKKPNQSSKDPIRSFFIGLLFCILLSGVAGCSTSTDDSRGQDEFYEMEQDVLLQINEYRQSQFLSLLRWNETIADYCRTHSLNMAAGAVDFGHDGFDDRVDGIAQTISYKYAAENVASNNYSDPVTTAVEGWLNSPGHLENIEGDYNLTGIGVAQDEDGVYYFTQIFIRQ
jgi:uncharacterized protein YkwD